MKELLAIKSFKTYSLFIVFLNNFSRSIIETLELMKLDMANFTINQARPYMQQHYTSLEKDKFKKYVDYTRGTQLFLFINQYCIIVHVVGFFDDQFVKYQARLIILIGNITCDNIGVS